MVTRRARRRNAYSSRYGSGRCGHGLACNGDCIYRLTIPVRPDFRRVPMASRLNPYISFADTARPALEFYKEVFGGTLTLSSFGDFGDKEAPGAELIMHGMLETPDGFTLMAADTPPGMEYKPGSSI